MAIPKKGSRSIVVEGITYRWYMRRKVSYSKHYCFWNGGNDGTTIAVEHAQNRGSALIVTLPQLHPCIESGIPVVPVVPSQVAHCIALALTKGWQPAKPGAAFHMNIAA